MAVAHDGAANVSVSCAGVSSQSVSKTTSGSNRCAVIHIGTAPQTADVSAVTYGGSAATEIITLNGGATTEELAALYRYLAPPTGSTTVQVTWDEAAYGAFGVSSYSGVDQTTPTSGAVSTSTTGVSTGITLNVSSATDDMVVDCCKIYRGGGQATAGASQTQVFNTSDGSFGEYASGSYEAGASTVTMSWSWASSAGHATQVGANLRAAASGDPTDGSAAGQGTGTATGSSTVTANASSDGVATATAVGQSTVSAEMNAAGAAAATAVSASLEYSVMNGAGAALGTAEGRSTVSAEMNGAGAATATAVGDSTGGGVSVEGAAYSRGNSAFIVLEWTAEGTATGYEVGYSQTSGSGNYTIVDVGNVTTYTLGPLAGGTWYYAVRSYDGGGSGDWSTEASASISTIAVAAGQSTVSAEMNASGAATATAVGQSTVSAVMNGAGTSDGQAVGQSTVSAEMNGAGASTAEAVGDSTTGDSTIGYSAGASDGQAVGAVLVEAAGSSAGSSTNTAEGAATITAAGESGGVAVGTAVGTTLEAQTSTRYEGRRRRRRKDDAEEMQAVINHLTLYILRGEYGEIVYDRDLPQ